MFTVLVKLILVISSVMFGLNIVVQTKDDNAVQKAMDVRVAKMSGGIALISALALWLTGW
jgi:hypothetical protein